MYQNGYNRGSLLFLSDPIYVSLGEMPPMQTFDLSHQASMDRKGLADSAGVPLQPLPASSI